MFVIVVVGFVCVVVSIAVCFAVEVYVALGCVTDQVWKCHVLVVVCVCVL